MKKITLILFSSLIYFTGFAQGYQIKQNEKGKYYFIDENEEEILKLGEWDKANKFDFFKGCFTEVSKEGIAYYLDTLGNAYRVAYSIEDLSLETKALNISQEQFDEFPSEVLNYPNLEVLIIDAEYEKENNFFTLPSVITQLKKLKFFSLKYCKIQQLPESIGELQNLQELDLSNNQLNTLPESIGELQNLQYLYLWSNQLNTLPESIGELQNLQELDLSNNQLSILPESIGELQNLQYLYLEMNQLSILPKSIGELQNLQELYLQMNQLSILPKSIGELQNLQELYLEMNPISKEEKERIKKLLPNCKGL